MHRMGQPEADCAGGFARKMKSNELLHFIFTNCSYCVDKSGGGITIDIIIVNSRKNFSFVWREKMSIQKKKPGIMQL